MIVSGEFKSVSRGGSLSHEFVQRVEQPVFHRGCTDKYFNGPMGGHVLPGLSTAHRCLRDPPLVSFWEGIRIPWQRPRWPIEREAPSYRPFAVVMAVISRASCHVSVQVYTMIICPIVGCGNYSNMNKRKRFFCFSCIITHQ